MAATQRQAVAAMAGALPGVSLQDFSDDMMSLQAAADVVLAMGGYNTVCELLSLGKRGVLVPRVKPGQEQCIRAERMAAMGLLAMVHPEQLTPTRLMQAVLHELDALDQGLVRTRLKRLQGLEQATAAIFDLIGLANPATACDDALPGPAAWQAHVATRMHA
jgi:predicted glycosyltransferase